VPNFTTTPLNSPVICTDIPLVTAERLEAYKSIQAVVDDVDEKRIAESACVLNRFVTCKDNYDRKQNTLTDYDPRPIFTPTDIKPMPGVPGMGVAYVPVPIPIPLAPSAGAPPPPPPPPPPVAPTAASTKKKEGETGRAKGKEKEKEKPKDDSDDEENWYPFMPKFLDHGAPAAIYHQRQRSMHLSELGLSAREHEREMAARTTGLGSGSIGNSMAENLDDGA